VGHPHDHSHQSRGGGNERRLAITLCLAASYMVAEFVGGLLTNSLALLADAGHMLSDVGALTLSLFALWIARRPSSPRFTYGYYRTEILAALVNGAALLAIAASILLEALERFSAPPDVRAVPMLAVATGGLAINLAGLWILGPGREENLNLRGAWLHVLADALGSVGAMAAGALIWAFGWRVADPIASMVIALLVIHSAFALLREAVAVLLEGAPGHIDVDEVRDAIGGLPCVAEVHDLHVWTIASGVVSLSCHAVKAQDTRSHTVLGEIQGLLRERFGIGHATIQVEPDDFEEELAACPEGVAGQARG
jgi:cobalt-zinc-cadmium efflux system protein